MKNKAILTQQNGSFTLNGEPLSREEISVFLDLLDFTVDHRQNDTDFFENAQISLQDVTEEEFDRVYHDFEIWKRVSDLKRESEAQRESAYVETI